MLSPHIAMMSLRLQPKSETQFTPLKKKTSHMYSIIIVTFGQMPAQDLVLGSGLRYVFYKHNRADDIFFALNNLYLTTNFLLNQSPHDQFYSPKKHHPYDCQRDARRLPLCAIPKTLSCHGSIEKRECSNRRGCTA